MADHQESDHDMQEPIEELNIEPAHDPSSLFIPERTPVPENAATPPLTRSPIPTPSATPARQPIYSTKPSIFQNILKMQKKAQARRTAYQNLSAAPTGSPSAEGLDSEEMDHRHALAEFQRQKDHFNSIRAQHNNHLPFRQEVEWAKIKGAEDARLKKRARGRVNMQEGIVTDEDLFPSLYIQPEGGEDEDEDDEALWVEGSARKKRRGEQPRREAEPVSMQGAELRAMRVALEASSDIPKKKRKGAASLEDDDEGSNSAPPKSKPSRSKASKPSRGKAARTSAAKGGTRKTAKSKRELERVTKQANSLFSSNVFEEQAGMGAADQPVFRTRRKADLLKELIESIPTGEQSAGRNDMNVLLRASRDFDGTASCKIAENGNWLVRGMKTSLKGYQMLGSAWMRNRENDTKEPKGGLMADQMGLGKTLQMLANIVNSRDAQERLGDRGPKTTLLVASPSLLTQWGSEIRQHTNFPLKIMKYGAGTRVDSTVAEAVLRGHDIVLATYNEVMRSYPCNVPPIELQTARQKTDWWEKTYHEKRGVLHRMFFKRIVLDEAQQIKNHKGRISIACRALMAEHKWALSGTPILNGLDELYSYFKFLEVPQTASYKIFKENYCGSGKGENVERLLARLSQFMIRRTHADRMFNAPILKLPHAIQITHWCDFNPVERSIYNIVHKRFALNINNLSRNDDLSKSYNNILTMLLRLRQLAAHPLMLQFVMRDLLEREDIEMIKDVVRDQAAAANVAHGRIILVIRRQLDAHEAWEKQKAADKAKRRFAAQEEAKAVAKANGTDYVEPEDNFDETDDDAPFELPQDGDLDGGAFSDRGRERNKSGKSFGKTYDFKPYLNSLAQGEDWEKKKERAKCGECGRYPHKPWTTSCGHFLCETCYGNVMVTAAEEGRTNGRCKACGTIFAVCAPCDEEDDDMLGPSSGTRNRTQQQRRRERERLNREDVADDWLSLGGPEVLPSAKTLAIKSQILNWISEDPNVKIIIYTQFLAMIRILKKMCQQEGWASEEYHGKMSLVARDKAIRHFADDHNSRVLLASLRCGGLGLNLTMASKVVIVDPWWNRASEQQAFCRVFRIGQNDETFLSRMCVRNTVDERLIEMQNRKQKEIDTVMEDGGKTAKSLDIADLMRLFGNIEEGEDGRPFIVVENAPTVGGFHADRDHEGYADDL